MHDVYAYVSLALFITLLVRESKAAKVRELGRAAVVLYVEEVSALRRAIMGGQAPWENDVYERRRNALLEASERFYREVAGKQYDQDLIPRLIPSFWDEVEWKKNRDFAKSIKDHYGTDQK
jgi:hypothetical protein